MDWLTDIVGNGMLVFGAGALIAGALLCGVGVCKLIRWVLERLPDED